MSTTRKRSAETASGSRVRSASVGAGALLAAARAAVTRGELTKALALLKQVISLKGPTAAAARALLLKVQRLLAPKKAAAPKAKKPSSPAKPAPVVRSKPVTPPARKSPPSRGRRIDPRPIDEGAGPIDALEGLPPLLPPPPILPPTSPSAAPESPRPSAIRPRTRGRIEEPPIEAATPAEAAPPVVVQRTPHMDLSTETPAVGSAFFAEVFADEMAARPGEEILPIVVTGPAGQQRFDVAVMLLGTDHFTIVGKGEQTLTIQVGQPATNRVRFEVRVARGPKKGERPSLFAYFFYNGRSSGQIVREVKLGARRAGIGSGSDTPADTLQIDAGADPADIMIDILDPEQTRQHFVVRIRSRLVPPDEQPETGPWHLPSESGTLVGAFMKQFTIADAKARLRRLKGAGEELFGVAPEAFKTLYWKLIDRGTPPASMLITSQEPYVPWELMIPSRNRPDGSIERRQPLGVECAIGRWVHAEHLSPPHRIPLIDSFVVAPTYPGPSPKALVNAPKEVALVLGTVKGDWLKPADVTTIDERLALEGRSLLHLVCHGADSPDTGTQSIYLDGGVDELQSLEVKQLDGLIAAFRKKPLVFLNACEVGRPAIALSGIGGFANAFIGIGAAGVIAPLWSVRDSIAFNVAERFYTAVKSGGPAGARTYADILREIRALAYDPAIAEDTYAAYCFYGDPLATP